MWWRVVERSEGGIKWRREQELRGMTLRLGTDSDSELVQPEPIQNRKTHGTRLSKPRSRVKQYLGLGATHTASLGGTEKKIQYSIPNGMYSRSQLPISRCART